MKKLLKYVLAAALVAAISQTAASADILAAYDTANNGGNGTIVGASSTFSPVGSADGVTASNFKLGSGYTQDGGGGAFANGSSAGFYGGYYGGLYPSTLSAAETAQYPVYLSFTIQPTTPGTTLDLTDIDFSSLRFGSQQKTGGSATFSLESSVGGFTSGTTLANFSGAAFNGAYGSDVTLGSAFSNLTIPTEFRLYVWDSVPPTDPNDPNGGYFNSGISGSFLVNGSVISAAPEPAFLPMLGLGLLSLVFLARRKRAASI